jgi:hypothetical protein
MYLTSVVRDGIIFRLILISNGPPGSKTVKHIFSSECPSNLSSPNKPEWRLPSTRTIRRLSEKFLKCRCELRAMGRHHYAMILPIKTLSEDRAAFLAAIAVSTKITRVK